MSFPSGSCPDPVLYHFLQEKMKWNPHSKVSEVSSSLPLFGRLSHKEGTILYCFFFVYFQQHPTPFLILREFVTVYCFHGQVGNIVQVALDYESYTDRSFLLLSSAHYSESLEIRALDKMHPPKILNLKEVKNITQGIRMYSKQKKICSFP